MAYSPLIKAGPRYSFRNLTPETMSKRLTKRLIIALAKAKGVAKDEIPTPLAAKGCIRRDPTAPNGLNLWLVLDNLRKGAASTRCRSRRC
jgi:aspartate-semialdehyde dehydrogenase